MSDKNDLEKLGDAVTDIGQGLMGCGCLITIIVVVIILIL